MRNKGNPLFDSVVQNRFSFPLQFNAVSNAIKLKFSIFLDSILKSVSSFFLISSSLLDSTRSFPAPS